MALDAPSAKAFAAEKNPYSQKLQRFINEVRS